MEAFMTTEFDFSDDDNDNNRQTWIEFDRHMLALASAIGTSLIPNGRSISELVAHFTKIQCRRTFSDGYSHADLSMAWDESRLVIEYSSTRGTEVEVAMNFGDRLDIPAGITVSVWLPRDRVGAGRCHFEALTRAVWGNGRYSRGEYCRYEWIEGRKSQLYRLAPKSIRPTDIIPEWARDDVAAHNVGERPERLDLWMSKQGFTLMDRIPGTLRCWQGYGYMASLRGDSHEVSFDLIKIRRTIPNPVGDCYDYSFSRWRDAIARTRGDFEWKKQGG